MGGASVIVIGAGVVGISTALALQSRGLSVVVLDRSGVAAEASAGNAGALAFADIEPLATPGILRKAPKWLLDPLGPLSLPLGYAPKIAPWMLRFWRASWQDRYRSGVAAQSALMKLSRGAFLSLAQHQGLEDQLRHEGQLQLYEGATQYRAALKGWELRGQHGVDYQLLDSAGAIAEIQPGLDKRFTHAGFTPGWINLWDPKQWVEALAERFVRGGGRIETGEVTALAEGGQSVVTADGVTRRCSHLVICAGAWSHHLARMLGDKIPLETERGYNTTLPAGAFDLKTHVTFPNHGFVVTKIGNGLRVGGAVELAGLKRAPNYRRSEILLEKAARFLPGLQTTGGTQWMGFRPSCPDSLPVIGPATKTRHVTYAFGHGHLGLTQSAGTAQLVADLVTHVPPAIDLTPYRANRFKTFL